MATIKHKHAELIKAWADGAEIQCKQFKYGDGYEWVDDDNPYWSVSFEYRIKPTPRPQWQQDLIDAAKAGKVVEFKDLSGEWQLCLLNDFPESWIFYDSAQDRYRIRPEKVIRYLWAYGTETYRYQGSTFLSDAEARMQGFTKRLDWSATEFEE